MRVRHTLISYLVFAESFGYPWNAWFGLLANIFLALVQGWTTLAPFDAGTFVDAYILLPLFGITYVGYKTWFKTRFRRSHEIDLDSGMREDLDTKEELVCDESLERSPGKESLLKRLWINF
jgi:amino acid transporter